MSLGIRQRLVTLRSERHKLLPRSRRQDAGWTSSARPPCFPSEVPTVRLVVVARGKSASHPEASGFPGSNSIGRAHRPGEIGSRSPAVGQKERVVHEGRVADDVCDRGKGVCPVRTAPSLRIEPTLKVLAIGQTSRSHWEPSVGKPRPVINFLPQLLDIDDALADSCLRAGFLLQVLRRREMVCMGWVSNIHSTVSPLVADVVQNGSAFGWSPSRRPSRRSLVPGR